MQAKARIKQLNDRADEIRAILEPRQPPNEWQKKTYGFDDNWNKVNQGVAEGDSGAKYKVKSIGRDSKGDYYISPSTGKKVYKQAQVGDHEVPGTGEIKKKVAEEWSQKYKSSINCSHPKGFSQKAHCAGKKKHTESMMTMEMVCEDCGMCQTHGNLNEIKKGAKDSNGFTKCWPNHHAVGTKKGKNGGQVRNCKPNEDTDPYFESLSNSLAEKLDPNAPVDDWIQDFQKADPNKYHQFKNKTPEKKAQMAVAASYGAKNPSKKK
jgi:hypothetical protein